MRNLSISDFIYICKIKHPTHFSTLFSIHILWSFYSIWHYSMFWAPVLVSSDAVEWSFPQAFCVFPTVWTLTGLKPWAAGLHTWALSLWLTVRPLRGGQREREEVQRSPTMDGLCYIPLYMLVIETCEQALKIQYCPSSREHCPF